MGGFLERLLSFTDWLLGLVMLFVFLSALMSWLVVSRLVVNHTVFMIADTLNRITEPMLRPIRKHLPYFNGIDLSPLVLLIIIYFIRIVIIPSLIQMVR
jgi:YggT family protein